METSESLFEGETDEDNFIVEHSVISTLKDEIKDLKDRREAELLKYKLELEKAISKAIESDITGSTQPISMSIQRHRDPLDGLWVFMARR